MGTSCTATYEDANGGYTVTYNPYQKAGIAKADLERMKELHPDIYAEYVTVSESRRFHVKRTVPDAA